MSHTKTIGLTVKKKQAMQRINETLLVSMP